MSASIDLDLPEGSWAFHEYGRLCQIVSRHHPHWATGPDRSAWVQVRWEHGNLQWLLHDGFLRPLSALEQLARLGQAAP